MKRIIPILIIGFLALSTFGAGTGEDFVEKSDIIVVSRPLINEDERYVSIELSEATSYIRITGEPMLPKITKVFKLPFGSRVRKVEVDYSEFRKEKIQKEVKPAPKPLIDGEKIKEVELEYTGFYPRETFNYRTCTGLDGEERVVFLSVELYPIRYSPEEKTIYYCDKIEIEYSYTTSSVTFPQEYDLVIIAPSEFEALLQPLVEHKNKHNMKTFFMPLEAIYPKYNGRDEQEDIKLFIKEAIEKKGIRYVLLVGGMKGQSFDWYLPVRYSNNRAGEPFEKGFISDLYYADIYKEGGVFEDWDSNGNGIFAEFSFTRRDIIDGAPDVYVGRLACRDSDQVRVTVDKIITYEDTPRGSWFKRMLLVGGDTYPDATPAYEAEIDTEISASYMEGFTFEKLWASLGTLTGQEDMEEGINEGAGFIHMAGHANPSILVTFPPHDEKKEHKITILRMYAIPPLDAFWALFYQGKGISGFLSSLFSPVLPRLNNGEKQPVIVVGGCHNSQFNTSVLNILKYGFVHAYAYGIYVPKCFSWWLTSLEDGGAIATMGNSGLGMGLPGFDYPKGLDGWLFPRFFYNYGKLGKKHVGEAHSAAITDYVNEFDINKNNEDRQMVEQWVLLGDPSLLMGGYE
jgi:hypothetical protein